MFERFTKPARDVVVGAQQEARGLRHGYIGTEHLLLGILREGSGAGARALQRLGIDLNTIRSEVIREVGEGPPGGTREEDAEALRAIGIDLDEVRRRIEEAFGPGALERRIPGRWRRRGAGRCDPLPLPLAGRVPFTPRAKKVLELSLREALHLGHRYIGTEHILLGIVREGEGLASQVLSARGAPGARIRGVVGEEIERGEDPPSHSR
jgi:ATP-dependent Clp protease ATP-binding subunit ClpA